MVLCTYIVEVEFDLLRSIAALSSAVSAVKGLSSPLKAADIGASDLASALSWIAEAYLSRDVPCNPKKNEWRCSIVVFSEEERVRRKLYLCCIHHITLCPLRFTFASFTLCVGMADAFQRGLDITRIEIVPGIRSPCANGSIKIQIRSSPSSPLYLLLHPHKLIDHLSALSDTL
jgi:hypothetical protein